MSIWTPSVFSLLICTSQRRTLGTRVTLFLNDRKKVLLNLIVIYMILQ